MKILTSEYLADMETAKPSITRIQMQQDIENHPLFQEFVYAVHDDVSLPIRSTRHVLGERMSYAWGLVNGMIDNKENPLSDRQRVSLALGILETVPYLWNIEQWNLAVEAEIPRHEVQMPQLTFKNIWFTFESHLIIPEGYQSAALRTVETVFLSELIEDHLTIIYFGTDIESKSSFVVDRIRLARRIYPDDFNSEEVGPIGRILACLSFLRSPHIEKESRGLNRGERRSLGRHYNRLCDASVQFITLRRHYAAQKEYESHDYHGERQRYKDFRSLVSPFHRNQWYPSTQQHKLIWISPFLKGPEGAPIRQRTFKVSR